MARAGDAHDCDLGHYWWSTDSIWTVALFGAPTAEDASRLTENFAKNIDDQVVHSTLFDVRALVGFSPQPLSHLAVFVRDNREAMETLIDRIAVLHSDSLTEALTRGLGAMTGVRFPVETFQGAVDAYAWLGAEHPEQLAAELDDRIERSRAGLPALREYLRRHPGASLDESSRALGFSSRQLQRVLKSVNASYRDERSRVRVELAKELLLGTELKVEAVAAEVGYAKLQNFVEAFRRLNDVTPAVWRARQPVDAQRRAKLDE